MAELLATVDGSEAYHADWRELLAILIARGTCVDLLWCDTPYSEKTHKGHDASSDERAAYWAENSMIEGRIDPRTGSDRGASDARYEAKAGGRRAINYDPWTPADVHEFVAAWAPVTRGWFVTITDHVLAEHWSSALEDAGLYAFVPQPCTRPGARFRKCGDGPPSVTEWIVMARPRDRYFAHWNTTAARAARGNARPMPGYYWPPPGGDRRRDVVGGKPDWLHADIVGDCSARGGLVVDPTAGGGGAGRMAIQLGRRAILGDALREHADLCAAALREGAGLRDAARAYLPPPPRAEQIALRLEAP